MLTENVLITLISVSGVLLLAGMILIYSYYYQIIHTTDNEDYQRLRRRHDNLYQKCDLMNMEFKRRYSELANQINELLDQNKTTIELKDVTKELLTQLREEQSDHKYNLAAFEQNFGKVKNLYTLELPEEWKSQDGRVTKITELGQTHLENIIAKFKNRWSDPYKGVALLEELKRRSKRNHINGRTYDNQE